MSVRGCLGFCALAALGLAVTLGLGGCAYAPQEAKINPVLALPRPAAGTEAGAQDRPAIPPAIIPLVVDVRDERTRKLIGRRGDAMGAQAAITAPPNLVGIIQAAAITALRAQGYDPQGQAGDRGHAGASVPVLRISLRDLSYESHNKILAGYTISASAFVAVRLYSGANDFEQIYRSERTQDAFPTPTAADNDLLINAVLGHALGQALSDPALRKAVDGAVRAAAPAAGGS